MKGLQAVFVLFFLCETEIVRERLTGRDRWRGAKEVIARSLSTGRTEKCRL